MVVEFWIHAGNLKIFKAGGWVRLALTDQAVARTVRIRADVHEVEIGQDDDREPVVRQIPKR